MILKSKKNNEKIKNSWQIAKWLWTISKSLRTQSAINAIASILVVALDFAFIAATKQTIDIATGKNAHTMTFATICLITVIVLQILIGFSRRWIGALLGVKSQNRMQQRIFSRLLRSEWNGRETRHSGDILNRLERDVRDVTTVITDTLPSALGVGVRFVGAFIFLFSMDSKLACLIVCILPLFILMSRMYVHKMRKLNRAIRNTDSKVQSILTESIQHRMILKTLERIGTMTNHLEETQTLLRQQIRHSTKFSSISATLTRIGFATGYSVTFLWGAHRLQDGTITYGMMLAFIQLVGQIQGPFRDMTKFIPTIIGAFTASERLMELEDVPVEEEGAPVRFNQSVGIKMKHVTYTYPSGTRHILEDFSYDFPPGSSTAIVGETGAGKTTMIRLILSLLHPQTGSVEMYNNEKTVTTSPLTRCNIVYVPQGNTLFSGTIRYNLLLGNPDATEEEMKQALHLACADFVLSLPDGLDSRCGEMGTGLSEGQAQRIAIARALLKRGGILLLDEATSALDTQTEKSLLENLNQWIDGNRTLLFVTHRPAVLAHCDQVLHLSRQQ